MNADDRRHGTYAGYVAGCRNECCRTGARNYHKRRVYEGVPRIIDGRGLRRRVQALACLGWSMYDIADRMDISREAVRQWMLHDTILLKTHTRFAELYERMCMELPPRKTAAQRQTVGKIRNKAKRNGWAPPLAWDDIDLDDVPNMTMMEDSFFSPDGESSIDYAAIDEVAVQRAISGDRSVRLTLAERVEAIENWTGSDAQLERLTGWNVARDRRRIRKDGAA